MIAPWGNRVWVILGGGPWERILLGPIAQNLKTSLTKVKLTNMGQCKEMLLHLKMKLALLLGARKIFFLSPNLQL